MTDLRDRGRILYVSSVDVSRGDGPGVNEREFIVALQDIMGSRAHFVIPRPTDGVPEIPHEMCTFTVPHGGHNPLLLGAHTLSQIRQAEKLIAERSPDLLVFRLDVLPVAPARITRGHDVPFALKTLGQGLMNVFEGRTPLIGKPLGKLNRSLIRGLAHEALLVDTVSVSQLGFLNELLGIPPDKIEVIDNAVNTGRFFPAPRRAAREELRLDNFDPIIGYAGNLPYERGGLELLKAAPKLLRRHPNLGVVILGAGAGSDKLRELARTLRIEERCHLPGRVPYERIPTYVNSFDVGVSILRPQSQAASEQKVRQYVACGKPVVATTPGSNDFLAAEGLGSLVRHDDIEGIASALDRWLGLTERERELFEARALSYAEQHLSARNAVAARLELWGQRLDRRLG